MKICYLLVLIFLSSDVNSSSSIESLQDDCKAFSYSCILREDSNALMLDFDIPLKSATNAIASSSDKFRKLSIKIHCTDWIPLGGTKATLENFRKLSELGIESLSIEVIDKTIGWSDKFDFRMRDGILSVPKHFIDKKVPSNSNEKVELAME